MKYLKNVARLELFQEKCIGCKACVDVCPHNVFYIKDGKAVILDKDLCMECGACQRNCITGAILVRTGVGCAAAILNTKDGGECCSDCC